MKYIVRFNDAKISKKVVKTDVLDTIKLIFSYLSDEYPGLINFVSTNRLISINIHKPFNERDIFMNKLEEVIDQLKISIDDVSYEITNNYGSINIAISLLTNIKSDPLVRVNKNSVIISKYQFDQEMESLGIDYKFTTSNNNIFIQVYEILGEYNTHTRDNIDKIIKSLTDVGFTIDYRSDNDDLPYKRIMHVIISLNKYRNIPICDKKISFI